MDETVIEVRGLTKVFRGDIRALDGVSLDVARGHVHGLLGPNGAGKTTLIRVLATLLPPDAGTARVAGIDVRRDPGGVRARIGLAGQFAAVDDHLTGRENVEMIGRLYGFAARERRRRAADVLERIRLGEAADRPVKTYSGGMRRRLDLAASLVGRPAVLFLDEPTTGLDPAGRRDVWELVRGLVGDGATVLLTTQYLEEADALADRVTVVDAGRVVTEGSIGELKAAVGGATVELRIDRADRGPVLDVLRDLDARLTGDVSVRLPAVRGVRTLRDVLDRLEAAGVDPDDVTLRRPTLDDVFLSLTGRSTTIDNREAA